MNLVSLGWSDELQQQFEPHAERGLAPARVAAQHRGVSVLVGAEGTIRAEPAGRLRHAEELPAVGDWVGYRPRPGGEGLVEALLPRRTCISRKQPWLEAREQILAANVDAVFVVTTPTAEFSARRLERYLATAWESGAEPAIVLNKADLADALEQTVLETESVAIGVPVLVTSAETGEGVEELRAAIGPGRTAVFVGQSGVGKSSLLNRLLGEERQAVRDLYDNKRGSHTTRHRELFPIPGGGLVIDSPGLRELQLWDVPEGVDRAFADIASLAADCRFSDCSHVHEPGCAVREAVDPARLESYRKLQREVERIERKLDKRAKADERRKRAVFARSMRKASW